MVSISKKSHENTIRTCPSCGYPIQYQRQVAPSMQDFLGLPAGVKFDPTDQELLQHLEGKARSDPQRLHPLIDDFIPTIEGEDGICYTHPEKLPGVRSDGLVRHFFHRPSRAYTTGTRKRRKVHTDVHGSETRWHKTGKTRPVFAGGDLKGYKKILVLYTNYGKQRKPEKTNWIMHQYHLGFDEEEKDGELVVSKIFFQTQPRQCGSALKDTFQTKLKGLVADEDEEEEDNEDDDGNAVRDGNGGGYYTPSLMAYTQDGQDRVSSPHLFPSFPTLHATGAPPPFLS
ncbi:unnamed protein product [Musa acuminata subsp. burmannicoides]